MNLVDLQAMKRDGRKIVAVVCWDEGSAEAADAAGADIVSIGDSIVQGFEELLVYCRAVRRGVTRALVSCDLPEPGLDAARQVAAAGADLVKVEGEAAVAEIAAAGLPVWAQLAGDGDPVAEARRLERAGAALLNFRHSGPDAGAAVVAAVEIPVLGGLGGGPWLDGRVRAVHRLLDASLAAYVDDVRNGRTVQAD